jgi:hypothetical protein
MKHVNLCFKSGTLIRPRALSGGPWYPGHRVLQPPIPRLSRPTSCDFSFSNVTHELVVEVIRYTEGGFARLCSPILPVFSSSSVFLESAGGGYVIVKNDPE